MKPQRPHFPGEGRTIEPIKLIIFGFEICKVKHYFWIILYILSMVISLAHVIIEQSWDSLMAYWFLINVCIFCVIIITKAINYLIKNWNEPL